MQREKTKKKHEMVKWRNCTLGTSTSRYRTYIGTSTNSIKNRSTATTTKRMELERSVKRTLILANRLLENTNPGKPNLCEQKRAGIRNKGKKTMVHKGEMRWKPTTKEERNCTGINRKGILGMPPQKLRKPHRWMSMVGCRSCYFLL
jgi:hypothetical protein